MTRGRRLFAWFMLAVAASAAALHGFTGPAMGRAADESFTFTAEQTCLESAPYVHWTIHSHVDVPAVVTKVENRYYEQYVYVASKAPVQLEAFGTAMIGSHHFPWPPANTDLTVDVQVSVGDGTHHLSGRYAASNEACAFRGTVAFVANCSGFLQIKVNNTAANASRTQFVARQNGQQRLDVVEAGQVKTVGFDSNGGAAATVTIGGQTFTGSWQQEGCVGLNVVTPTVPGDPGGGSAPGAGSGPGGPAASAGGSAMPAASTAAGVTPTRSSASRGPGASATSTPVRASPPTGGPWWWWAGVSTAVALALSAVGVLMWRRSRTGAAVGPDLAQSAASPYGGDLSEPD